jgi:hypothetical protein
MRRLLLWLIPDRALHLGAPKPLPRFGNVVPDDIIKRLIDIEQLLMAGFTPPKDV